MAFAGFPSGARYTSVPNPLLGPLLEEIQDIAELKVVLRGIWLLQRNRGWPRMISQGEFLADSTLVRAFQGPGKDSAPEILRGLRLAVQRGIFLAHRPQSASQDDENVYYLLNAESDRRALSKMPGWVPAAAELEAPGAAGISSGADLPAVDRPNIYALYEDSIGMMSPFIAEELKEAEELYQWAWISEAFKIADTNNRRSWNYVRGILRRWASEGRSGGRPEGIGENKAVPRGEGRGDGLGEGREDGKPGRHSATGDRQKHIEDYQRRRRQIRDQPTNS